MATRIKDRLLKSIGAEIKKQRKMQGLTQIELAAKSSLSIMQIRSMEAGNSNPSIATLLSVFDALNCQLSIAIHQID